MAGSGSHVFAVWGYCISHADPKDHTVLLNPLVLSAQIGESQEKIEAAIEFLCDPDPKSKCPDNEGRRLVNISGYWYSLTTHEFYRNIKNNDERRDYMRNYMKDRRLKVNESLHKLTLAFVSVSDSVSGKDIKMKAGECFDSARKLYPGTKRGNLTEFEYFTKKHADWKEVLPLLELAIEEQIKTRKEANGFVPSWKNFKTWINNRCWEDETPKDTLTINKNPRANQDLRGKRII